MPITEDDLLKDAIAGTENEIFNEATGKSAPSEEGGPGDRSPEEMGEGLEGQLEAEKAEEGEGGDEAAEGEDGETDEGEGGQDRDPETGQFVAKKEGEEGEKPAADKAVDEKPVDPKARVPLSEHLSERKARQAAEKALADERTARETERSATKSEFEKLNARIDQFLAAPRPAQAPTQQQPAPAATEEPDIFQDTPAFVANLTSNIERKFEARFVEADMARAHEQHGEKFEKAYAAITSLDKNNPADRAQVQNIWKSATPGKALMDWYGKQETLRVVGADPDAFAERVRAEERDKLAKDPEFRKSVFETLKAEATGIPAGERPKSTFRMPKSLNSASGGQGGASPDTSVGDGSDRGVFDDAFRG